MPAATRGQLGVIARLLTDAGLTDRAHRIDIVAGLAGRPIESTKDLTAAEARSILRHLHQLKDIGELTMLVEQYRPAVPS